MAGRDVMVPPRCVACGSSRTHSASVFPWEIAELLSLRARADASCGEVRDLAVQKRLEVQDRLEGLQRIADVLDELIADCPGNGDLGACSIHEAIERAK